MQIELYRILEMTKYAPLGIEAICSLKGKLQNYFMIIKIWLLIGNFLRINDQTQIMMEGNFGVKILKSRKYGSIKQAAK